MYISIMLKAVYQIHKITLERAKKCQGNGTMLEVRR
jgi:hypothetical protein